MPRQLKLHSHQLPPKHELAKSAKILAQGPFHSISCRKVIMLTNTTPLKSNFGLNCWSICWEKLLCSQTLLHFTKKKNLFLFHILI
jgi:hypothetical protein